MSVIQFPLTLKGNSTTATEPQPRIRSFSSPAASQHGMNALWGVPGKQALLDQLDMIGSLAPQAPLSFVVVRVHGLDEINSRSDTRAGEAVLRNVAARMWALTRATDTMGRLGASSFGLVLQGTGATAAGAVAARLSHHLNQVTVGRPPVEVRVSAATGRGVNAEMLPGAALESLEECC